MNIKKITLLISTLFISAEAVATDGYFQHGYGVKAQGAGGVAIALPQDALVIASNPAGIGFLDDRIDIGATWFRPVRSAEIVNSGAPVNGRYDGNESQNFVIPEFGYIKTISDNFKAGVAVYGNGGMNTEYKNGIPLFGNTRAGVDLMQLFVSPTITWQPNPQHAFGVSLNLAYQRFEAKGLQNFANAFVSESPNNVTNNGHDHSYGAGLHFGWMGELNQFIRMGAHYQTKTYMTKFDDYKGLFANQGEFDIPENYGIGIAIKATPKLTLAGDIQRIHYNGVDSVGNQIANFFTAQLGSDNGAGFGWQNTTVYKIGMLYQWDKKLTLRAGYNHVDQPIPRSQTLFNILAPGVVEGHLTLGATWKFNENNELSLSYMHAFEHTVRGKQSIPNNFGGGDANLRMRQDSVGIAYSWLM